MAVWLKRIGIGLLVVIVLLAAVVAGALVLIDTAALKRIVSEQVEANTGRELVIEGDLGISVFPWIGFELGAARLANAAGFDQRPFLALERAELRVRLLPLLRREVAVDRVVLHGLEVNLARNAAGRGNWEDLVPAPAAGEAPAEPAPAAGEPVGAAVDLRIEGVELREANLYWRDAVSGRDLAVRDLELETGALAPGLATPVRLRVTLEPTDAPSLELALQTEATFEPAGPRVRLRGLAVDLLARGAGLPGGELAARVGGDVDADLAAATVRVDPLELGLAGTIDARGTVGVDTAGETPSVRGRLAVAAFDPRELARALEVALPQGLDQRALKSASAEFAFAAQGEAARIDDLVLTLDDTRATGSVRARAGTIPELDLRLAVDAIDLDRYLPAAARGEATAADTGVAASGNGGDPVASLPLEALRGRRASALIDVGRLGWRGLDARDATLRARLDDGLLTLERLGAGVAGGSLAIAGRLDGRTDVPAAGLGLKLAGIQSGPLLQALAGSVPVSGRLDADIDLETAGPTLDAWIGALDGRLATTFSDGAIEGINIARRIRVAWARLQGNPLEEAAAARRTDFSRLHFAATVRDGVLRSDTLDLRAPLLRVGGAGEVDLARRRVDYTARVLVTGTLEGQGGRALDELKGVQIPLRFSGPLTGPKIELALGDALEAKARAKKEALEREAKEAGAKAKRELEQELEEEKKKLEAKKKKEKQKAREKLEKEIEGLFD